MSSLNDNELLELAAKAAGLEYDGVSRGEDVWFDAERGRMHGSWNPLTDDGDALRLAVKLNLMVTCEPDEIFADHYIDRVGCSEEPEGDPYAATRRAIVRAAAEIGKAMP